MNTSFWAVQAPRAVRGAFHFDLIKRGPRPRYQKPERERAAFHSCDQTGPNGGPDARSDITDRYDTHWWSLARREARFTLLSSSDCSWLHFSCTPVDISGFSITIPLIHVLSSSVLISISSSSMITATHQHAAHASGQSLAHGHQEVVSLAAAYRGGGALINRLYIL